MSSSGALIRKQEPSFTCQFRRSLWCRGRGWCHSTTLCCARTLPAAALSQTVARVVHEMDPAVPVMRFRDMETVVAESIQRPRFLAQLLGLFAGLALLLAAVGTYGVLSSLVAERRHEISIRMALGADRSSVLVLVMREGLLLTAIGVVVGLAGAFGLNRLIASLLFGVDANRCAHGCWRDCHDDHRGSGGMCAASLASVETRSERGAESIAALEPPDRWRWLSCIG